ncbi:hypothetical protein QR680_000972 [Steinernema hermaphroditum]|uniref:Uncharacterized protein n=1 Tax=Steinernema hermaphroditum TaxID=289476 RepID=A0AA39GWI9_9BILA|nr:hypothetical protein QR680_000972 [Steinernema hermaphroditum]
MMRGCNAKRKVADFAIGSSIHDFVTPMLSAFHYSQSGVYELQLKNRYGYRNAWATICFATAVFSTLLLICTLLGLLLVYSNERKQNGVVEGRADMDVHATYNRPNDQWILSGQLLNKIWFAQLETPLSERDVSVRHPARRCSRTWVFEVSDRCRHDGECTDDDLVYCRDRCQRARSYCSVFGRRYSDDWSSLVEVTWSATGRLTLIAIYNSTSSCVLKQLFVTEDHRFVASRRTYTCPFDHSPNQIKAVIGDDSRTVDWLAWTLAVNSHVSLFANAPAHNFSVSYRLKFNAINILGIAANQHQDHSAQIVFGEHGNSNLWLVKTERKKMNLKSRPKLPEDCEPFAMEKDKNDLPDSTCKAPVSIICNNPVNYYLN